MPIVEWEGYMRDGMTLRLEDIEIFEGREDQGMCLSSVKNRRVLLDFDMAKKYKHFDEKEYLKEVGKEVQDYHNF